MGTTMELTAADGHRFRAYTAGATDQPNGIVLCHESHGLNRYIRGLADRTAALGYFVIVPDLLARVQPGIELNYLGSSKAQALALADQVSLDDALLDVGAAMAALGRPAVGIIGCDLGATIAWLAASRLPGLRACIGFYGPGIADARQEIPRCPTQLHFAEFDHLIPSANVEAIRHAQPQVMVEVHPDTTHGFVCEEQESFDASAAENARDTAMAFLRRHICTAPAGNMAPAHEAPLRAMPDQPPASPEKFSGWDMATRRRAFG